jgi:hypothetical protein
MEDETIFGDIPREDKTLEEVLDSVDKELEVENPTESLPEKEEPDLKQNNAWKELREARELAEAKAQELEARLQAIEKGGTEEKSEFVNSLVGDNEEVEKHWAKEKESLKEQVKQEIIQDQVNAQKKEQEQKEYWNNWTNERLSEVEKEFNVDFKTNESKKNELSKVMLDYSPTDEQGNLDYRKGWKIVSELSKVREVEETQKTQVKKNIADATVSKETSTQQNKGFVTSNDIRGKDWRSYINN